MKRNRKGFLPVAAGNILWGLLISWCTATLICMIGAAMMAAGTIREGDGSYCTLIALMLGSFSGAVPARFKSESKHGLWCLIQGIIFFVSLLLIGTLLFDGSLSAVSVTAMVTIGAAAVTALLGKREKKGIRQVRRKYKIGSIV